MRNYRKVTNPTKYPRMMIMDRITSTRKNDKMTAIQNIKKNQKVQKITYDRRVIRNQKVINITLFVLVTKYHCVKGVSNNQSNFFPEFIPK